jgi:hypothetical protein
VRRFADKPARSEEVVLFAPSRNSVLPDGSLAAKEIFEAICSARRERTFTPGTASKGFTQKLRAQGERAGPAGCGRTPALAKRRAGEFEVLAYKVGLPCNRRGWGFLMLTDRYGLALSTASAAARDDYVYASDQALTFYPGAAEAYDRAIAADPRFALAQAGKALVLMRQGDIAGARAALDAKDVSAGLPHREASHIRFFDLVFAGRTEAAIAALYAHLTAWPRDALVVASAANPNGLIGASGRIGQKHQIAMLMDSLAPL